MADKAFASLLAKMRRLEEDYEEMSAKVDLLIHSVNNLYDEVYSKNSNCGCGGCKSTSEDIDEEPTDTDVEETGNKVEGIADVILAIVEELERRKRL